jgi:hypothetical protein
LSRFCFALEEFGEKARVLALSAHVRASADGGKTRTVLALSAHVRVSDDASSLVTATSKQLMVFLDSLHLDDVTPLANTG